MVMHVNGLLMPIALQDPSLANLRCAAISLTQDDNSGFRFKQHQLIPDIVPQSRRPGSN